jgi:hypothetical protein
MPGVIYRAVEKRIFDFTGLAASSTSTMVGAKAMDLSQFREANVIARFHAIPGNVSGVSWPASATVVVSARVEAPTSEDPADFLGTVDLGSVTFTAGTDTPPVVKAFQLAGGGSQTWGAWLRVYIKGNTGASTGAFQVMLSVDVNGKS